MLCHWKLLRECYILCTVKTTSVGFESLIEANSKGYVFFISTKLLILVQCQSRVLVPVITLLPLFCMVFINYWTCSHSEYVWNIGRLTFSNQHQQSINLVVGRLTLSNQHQQSINLVVDRLTLSNQHQQSTLSVVSIFKQFHLSINLIHHIYLYIFSVALNFPTKFEDGFFLLSNM